MLRQHFWSSIAVLPYLPALTIPIGIQSDGLPAGIDIMGAAYSDLRLSALAIRLADALEQAYSK